MADFDEKLKDLNNTEDTTDQFEQDDINNNKLMAVLAYLSWLVLIPLFGAKESKFARYHVNQGLVLAIAEIVAVVLLGILGRIPAIGFIFRIVKYLVELGCAVLAILGILNAANGKAKELPIVGKFKIVNY